MRTRITRAEDLMVYVGKDRDRKCGCLAAVVWDDPANPAITARYVAQMIESGLIIERVQGPVSINGRCFHGPDALPKSEATR